MGTENGVRLEVDQQKRMDVSDVITMLKGLRNEAAIKIVRTSDSTKIAKTKHSIHDEEKVDDNNSTHSFYKSSAVTGKTDLPQIRELNEIAALLRSMDSQKNLLVP